jgi:hypothetical protein
MGKGGSRPGFSRQLPLFGKQAQQLSFSFLIDDIWVVL